MSYPNPALCLSRLMTASDHTSDAFSKSYGHPDLLGILVEQGRLRDGYVIIFLETFFFVFGVQLLRQIADGRSTT